MLFPRSTIAVGLLAASSAFGLAVPARAHAQERPAEAAPPAPVDHPVPAVQQSPKGAPSSGGTRVTAPRRVVAPRKAPAGDAEPEQRRPIRIELTSGYGFDLDPSVTKVNPFRVSFGIRGGYAMGPVYVGTRFLFFTGEARVLADGTEQSADEWLLGFEGGYGFRAGPLVFRPELGFGLAISSSEGRRDEGAMAVPVDTSSEDPYVELGTVLELDLSRRLVIGVDARAPLVLGKQTATSDGEVFGLVVLGTIGMRF